MCLQQIKSSLWALYPPDELTDEEAQLKALQEQAHGALIAHQKVLPSACAVWLVSSCLTQAV